MPLVGLALTQCSKVTDAGLAELRAAPLKDIHISGSEHITNDGIQALVEGKLVKKLNLTGCVMLNEGILSILMGLALVELFLSCTNISDAGLQELIRAVPTIKVCLFDPSNGKNRYLQGQAWACSSV